jgi:mitotic spindle assembly checkpoint protein MAD2B
MPFKRPPNALPLPEAYTLLTSFNSFLTIAIHNILYYRNIYPSETFLAAKAFNLPVHQSRHPKVCTWIKDAVDHVATELAQGSVERVAVVIHAPSSGIDISGRSKTTGREEEAPFSLASSGVSDDAAGTGENSSPQRIPPNAVLERWVFDVSHYPAWPGGASAMRDFGAKLKPTAEEGRPNAAAAAAAAAGRGGSGDAVNWVDVDETLRGVIRKMALAAERMDRLPEGCAFTMAIELKEEGRAPIGVRVSGHDSRRSYGPAD